MKTGIYLKLSVFALSLFVLAGCGSPSEKGDKTKDDAKESDKELEETGALEAEIAKYKKESSTEISENEQLILGFREKIKELRKDLKENYEEQISLFEQQNKDLKAKMEEYSDESRENWEKFKAEFKTDMKELGQAIRNFVIENETE